MSVLSSLHRRGADPRSRLGTVFVLSGGGSAGAAQVGMLRALLEAGIVPDAVVGCSVGALNAASFAVDPTLERVAALEAIWRSLDRRDLFSSSRRQTVSHLIRRDAHLYEPDGLHDVIRRAVPVGDLSQTAIPCHVVTTDLATGRPCYWSAGDPTQLLAASACLPGIFPPVELGDSLHVDGGVSCPLPSGYAVRLGADRVWALDVSGGWIGRRGDRMTALDVLLLSFSISRSLIDRVDDAPRVTRLPRVDAGNLDLRDFSHTAELVEAGYTTSRAYLAELPVERRGLLRRIPHARRQQHGVAV